MAGVVERWQAQAFPPRRIDLFGIIDIIAIRKGEILGVQSTSMGARLEHVRKLTGECREQTLAWLDSGAKFLLVCWKKKKKVRGGKAFAYVPHEEDLKEALNLSASTDTTPDSKEPPDSGGDDSHAFSENP